MENRFGVKDFFLFLLLGALIVLVALAMVQYDRQYQAVYKIEQNTGDEIRLLQQINRSLQRGVVSSATTQASAPAIEGEDPFTDLRKLRDDGKYDEGDWLVENFPARVAKITPLLATDLYGYIVWGRVLETLAWQDTETFVWHPLLASGWTQTDNTAAWQAYVDKRTAAGAKYADIINEPACPDAASLDFKIRHGVTFSDGSPFTADDVVFTFDWVENPAVDAPRFRQGYTSVRSWKALNDYEVVFTFKEPFYLAFENIVTQQIMSQKFYSKFTATQFNDSVGDLIGTGPYRLESPSGWKPQDKITLYRNERYWGLSPSYDRLVYYQIEADQTESVMFGNGELDQISMSPQPFDIMLKNQEVMQHSKSMAYLDPLSGYYFIGWNQLRKGQPTLFADKRVRQAMTMLIDRQGLCQRVMNGYAEPAPGPYSRVSKQHDPNLADWTYDPEKAKALLKEAGFEDRGHGILERADGTPFTFHLTYPAKNETIEQEVQFVQQCLAREGVNLVLDGVDWAVIDGRLRSRDFDAINMGWGGGSYEDDIYQMFDSSQIQDQGDNFVSFDDPALDAAIHKARTTLDPDARTKYWHDCERLIHDDQPYTFLFDRKTLRLFNDRIQNAVLTRGGMNLILDRSMPFPWYTPGPQQKYKE